mmetsp:Transcript_32222/g.41415  ORF Transcript_32222/g.41415 Transcript_32222/m.41415 type:complete len:299 (-) Transcript_32222:379-1275(-)
MTGSMLPWVSRLLTFTSAIFMIIIADSCTAQITEDFDSGWGEFSNTDSSLPWTRSTGSIQGDTGPRSDHTSGTGYYAFVASSSNNYPYIGPFYLQHSIPIPDHTLTISFYYSMYGTFMGTLNVETSIDGSSWNQYWTKSGNQGTSWQLAEISLTSSENINYIRFAGTTGEYWDSDMAIDDFSYQIDPSPLPTVSPQPSSSPTLVPSSPTQIPSLSPTSLPTSTHSPTYYRSLYDDDDDYDPSNKCGFFACWLLILFASIAAIAAVIIVIIILRAICCCCTTFNASHNTILLQGQEGGL